MLAVVRSAIDAWSCLSGHPGLLVPVDVLVSAELDGSQSLVVVHSYIPGAASLTQAHLQPTQVGAGSAVLRVCVLSTKTCRLGVVYG